MIKQLNQPVFLHMLGIPGAGKTSFLDVFITAWCFYPLPVLLGFDQVMQAMPGYQMMEDKHAAFAAFELLARDEGYQQLERLVVSGQSILFDNGGSAATHIDILRRARNAGYRIVLVSIGTSILAAQKRVDARAVIEGRHTPMSYLDDRAAKLAVLEGEYRSLTPYFYEIYNDGQDFEGFRQKCVEVTNCVLHDLVNKQGEYV